MNYEICVESEKDLSTWYAWNFNVTLTDPDGEVVSKQVSKYALALSTYDIKIQYYYLDSSDINAYQLTLYIEVSPTLNAAFGAPYSDNSTYIPLAYSSISVSSSQEVDGKVDLIETGVVKSLEETVAVVLHHRLSAVRNGPGESGEAFG